MNNKIIPTVILAVATILLLQNCKSQQTNVTEQISIDSVNFERGDFRAMFYNCENLFDTFDDTLKNDDEFLPDGAKFWSLHKYYEKLSNISKVITAVGGWEPPEIVGLCEIENQYVLEGITKQSPLKAFNYKIIHYESPDKRGIDVALLYQPNKFKPIFTKKIRIDFPGEPDHKTRDILYVVGTTTKKDTLHVFVNHWPSRWGGMLESEDSRIYVASVLRHNVDSIFNVNSHAKILIMGDLNDFPDNKSVLETLNTLHDFSDIKSNELHNLSYYLQFEKGKFSHRYQGEAGVLDQMIVSGALLDSTANFYTTKEDAHIYDADFLLEKEENFIGYKPYRTYIGYKYHGGYSDHLPPYLDFHFKK
ncbi:MAG: endonuclease [Bacteroidales bacterium]|nr:endonuclease [Bacteroidales bacterium]